MAVDGSSVQFALELIISHIRGKDVSNMTASQKEYLRACILDARRQLDDLFDQCQPIEVVDISATSVS